MNGYSCFAMSCYNAAVINMLHQVLLLYWRNEYAFPETQHQVNTNLIPKALGKFDWGVWYVIIFLYVWFWIRLAAISKRGKKVRTVAFPAVRSVNKSRDTRNCVQNKPEYAICFIFTTRSYYKAQGLFFCYLILQIRHNFNRLDDGHCDATSHRKMSLLCTAGAMVTTHENVVIMWSFKGPKLFCVL